MRLSRILVTVVFLFVITTSGLLVKIQPAGAADTIYFINPDGSINPSTSLISTVDNVTYTLTGNISGSIYVRRNNIMLDGAGYTLQGNSSGSGIDLNSMSNVTVEHTRTELFYYGIFLMSSSNNTLLDNTARARTTTRSGIGPVISHQTRGQSGHC